MDMSLFLDPLDGQAYLIRSVANRYNAISRLSADFLGSQGVISTYRPVFEGMALFRHPNQTIYCIGSHLTGWNPNPLILLRAEGETPWRGQKNRAVEGGDTRIKKELARRSASPTHKARRGRAGAAPARRRGAGARARGAS